MTEVKVFDEPVLADDLEMGKNKPVVEYTYRHKGYQVVMKKSSHLPFTAWNAMIYDKERRWRHSVGNFKSVVEVQTEADRWIDMDISLLLPPEQLTPTFSVPANWRDAADPDPPNYEGENNA